MAYNKVVDSAQLNGAMTATANAIRSKTGDTATIAWDLNEGFATAIDSISTSSGTADATATASDILSGKTAYVDGVKIEGTILSLGATTYNTSSSNQEIAAGKYLSGKQTIRAVTTSGISAANIKYNQTIKVGDSADDDRIAGVTGTFTSSSTVSSGQTAAAAAQIRSGYSAWVNGTEVKGSIANATITNNTTLPSGSSSSGTINRGSYIKIGAGYYGSDAYYQAQTNSGTKTITASGTTSVDGYANASVAAGTITNNTSGGTSSGTINRGSQIKIGAGYYNNDTYYTAQSNSGTKTISSSGTISVDGYANVSVASSSVTQRTTTVSSNTATRGTATWGAGWISSGSIGAASFANSATNGITYVDISNTTEAPVLVAGNYLYINKGYTDNVKISLAKLVPDGASADVAAGHILSGYSAYNNDGTLIAGNIASKSSTNVTHIGKTVTVPAGYYASQVTHDIDTGTVVASVSSNSSGSASMAATGFTAASSATSYYVTLSTSAGSVKAKAAGGTSGYVTSSTTNETSATSVSVSGNGNKLYIPAGSITNNTTLPSGKTSSGTINRGNYIKIGAGYYPEQYWYAQNVSNGTITNNTSGGTSSGTINRGSQIKIGAGYYASDTYYTAQANSGTKTITGSGTTSVDGYANVSVAAATPAFDGGGLSGTATASGSGATISDSTNNSGISITTACTATRANVLYNGAVAGWVSKADNDVALSSTSTAMTAKTYYINEVTLPKGKSFGITVYTGASTTTKFVFTTDANGNTTVTES